MFTLRYALTGAGIPVGEMVGVWAETVPADIRRSAREWVRPDGSWSEISAPLSSQGGCQYGCKIYARRWGNGIRFAVFHSPTYGHGRQEVTPGPVVRECH